MLQQTQLAKIELSEFVTQFRAVTQFIAMICNMSVHITEIKRANCF